LKNCVYLGRDRDAIGIFGSSYSGGHVLKVGAIDRRVKAVVSQVPLCSGHRNARRIIRADKIAKLQAMFEEDRRARARGEAPAMLPVVDLDPDAPSALPTPDSFEWFISTHTMRAPSWKNEVTTLRYRTLRLRPTKRPYIRKS
jgi:hypothetical protein